MIPEDIYTLLSYFENSSLESLDLELGNTKIKVKKGSGEGSAIPKTKSVPVKQEIIIEKAVETIKEEVGTVEVTSPLVGIFYEASSPDQEAFASLGSVVKKGDVMGLIESMKMFNEIVAPVDGIIEEILVSNQDLVEFGTPLFKIKED